MVRVDYVLSNGLVVNTMKEAKASGLAYQVSYSEIMEKPKLFAKFTRYPKAKGVQ